MLVPVGVLAGATFLSAAFVAERLELEWIHVLIWFTFLAVLVTAIIVLSGVLWQVLSLAKISHPDPLGQLRLRWLARPMRLRLVLSAVIAPMFITGFVILKAAETMTIPYDWDRLLTDVDFMIFGADPWVSLHAMLNHFYIPTLLEWIYVGWQLLLPASLAAVAIWMKPRDVAIFFSAMFATWIVAGVIVAGLMHSAGPIFAYVLDDQLGARFEPLRASLMAVLDPDSRILSVQQSLALRMPKHIIGPGGGVSAMPSVHVAVTAIYICAAWGHKYWRGAALLFAALIWLGSVYFGYHYVTDGPVGFAIAITCWFAAAKLIRFLELRGRSQGAFSTPWDGHAR